MQAPTGPTSTPGSATAPDDAARWEHQPAAVTALAEHFDRGGERATLVMPCGSGKTRVAAELARTLGTSRVVVFVSSLALVEQSAREWLLPGFDVDPVIVCSDASTAAGFAEREGGLERSRTVPWHQRKVPVTTDSDRLARLLARGPRHGTQVVFCTYHSAPVLAAAVAAAAGEVTFDLLVADEAHRLAGAPSEAFRLVLDDAAVPARRRVHMTATPVMIDRVGDAPSKVSMGNISLFGEVVYRMTFADAIAAGVLTDYRVVVVAEPDLADVSTAGDSDSGDSDDSDDGDDGDLALAAVGALRSSAARYGLRRVISFHGRVESAQRFSGLLRQSGHLTDDRPLWCRVVSAQMPVGERRRTLAELDEQGRSALAVVSNARCLGEGVDLPAVDAVLFASPKYSVVDIVQSVGRVLRHSHGKQVGTVIIPVRLPAASPPGPSAELGAASEDDDSALLASAFGHVWSVLRALRAHDERLGAELDVLGVQQERRGTASGGRDVAAVTWLLPDRFRSAAQVRMVSEAASGWEQMYGRLLRHVDEHGTARLAGSRAGSVAGTRGPGVLASWVEQQRAAYRRGLLPDGRRRRLEVLPGWVWSVAEAAWQDNVTALAASAGPNSRVRPEQRWAAVPAVGPGYSSLGEFAAAQRVAYRAGRLSHSQVERLQQVRGWRWQALSADDVAMVDRLADHVAWEGDANLPADYREGRFAVGRWLVELRRRRLLGTAPAALLDEVAVVTPGAYTSGALRWEATETRWMLGYDAAVGYAAREGHLRPPEKHLERVGDAQIALAQWLAARRHQHRRGQLGAARVELLSALPGWRWETAPAPRVRTDIGAVAHGTRTGYRKGCTCERCTGANLAYNRQREDRSRRGVPTTDRVDAGPSRAHLGRLLAGGATVRALARSTAMTRGALCEIADGKVSRVLPETERKVLALRLEAVQANVAASTLVDPGPTWRHLDTLLARGWSRSWLARELGAAGAHPSLQVSRTSVTAATADRVAQLAARVGGRYPPRRRAREAVPSLAELERAEHAELGQPGRAA